MTSERLPDDPEQIAKRLVESNFSDQEALDALEAVMADENNWEIAETELSELERRLGLHDDSDSKDGDEPDAPVPAPLLPRTPVLAGGNAWRLEEAVEESEGESLTP
jgi:hypothetical protein